MSSSVLAPELDGLAGQLVEALGSSITVAELYGPLGGPVYHELTADDTNEVRDVLALLRGTQGPVLELACGSGRLTLPLLVAGHEVTGIDTSQSLLSKLRDRLSAPSALRLARRLTLVEADMCALDLDGRFAAALLGTTTVGLVPPADRPDFFRRVHDHLAPGGLFVLSAHTPAATAGPGDPVQEELRPLVTPGAVNFVIDRAEPEHARRHVSILRIPAQGQPLLLTSTVHVPTAATLIDELTRAGFEVDAARTARPTSAAPADLSILVARRSKR
ncbi:daptide-type RiPP biosynthesis methyltransferase [Streptomyces sp. NPDC006463]|uniref:daptide-type RiPP biosynthesis methyltransferase n=1 Tax=Streptomyces sp. NPDC006463 TaxID=3364746 RepID=UPI0036A239C9